MIKPDLRFVGILIALALIISINQDQQKMEQVQQLIFEKPQWHAEYQQLVVGEGIDPEYTAETTFYDYSDPSIQRKIAQIMSISKSPREYVENAAELVFIEIDYNIAASDSQCISGIASENFEAGKGDCTEQGMALIALLRGAGIPARAVGGCLYADRSQRCDLFAAVPFKKPRYKELTQEDIEQGLLSRKQEIGSRQGGLHLFLIALVPDYEVEKSMLFEYQPYDKLKWIVIEPTTGEIVNGDSCYLYDTELVVPDDKKSLFCNSENVSYAIACAQK